MVIIIPNSHEKLTKSNLFGVGSNSHTWPRIHEKMGKYWEKGVFSAFYTENVDRDMGGGGV